MTTDPLGDEIDVLLLGPTSATTPPVCRAADALAVALALTVPPQSPPTHVLESLLTQIQPQATVFTQLAAEAVWETLPLAGLQRRILFKDHPNNRITFLLRATAGAQIPSHHHSGPEEFLLLEGDLHTADHRILHAGDYQRSDGDTDHGLQWTEHGCLALLIAPLSDHVY